MNKVLILNRRCIKHPQRGGAEKYTFVVASLLARNGFDVTWFSSKASTLPKKETINQVKFIRKGNELTTHFYGLLYSLNNKFDIIIDEFNGVGYFSFLAKKSLNILLIHQLYNEFWSIELGKIVGQIMKSFEKKLLKLYLKRAKVIVTVSKSTYDDLKKLGFSEVNIIYNGNNISVLKKPTRKNKNLTLCYVGRIKKTKNTEDVIKAFIYVKDKIDNAILYIMGNGPLLEQLQKKYAEVKNLFFLGFVDEKEKIDYLKQSHFLLVPSIREGWGQVVIEANAAGTPAIGYNVHGLRDSIINGKTGFLVNNYIEMANLILNFYDKLESNEYKFLCKNAIEWASKFKWEKTEKEWINLVKQLTKN